LKLVRGGLLKGDQTEDAARLISSSEHDLYIADDVVEINIAHTLMLVKIGCLAPDEGKLLAATLDDTLGKITTVPPEMEDVHMVVEDVVTKRIGAEIGGKLHTGKSRNDQVATALRMRLRAFLAEICGEIAALQGALLEESLLNGVKGLSAGQPLDRRDRSSAHRRHRQEAGSRRLAVDEHEARATLPLAASVLRAGEVQLLAEDVEQATLGVRGDAALRVVDREPNRHAHRRTSKLGKLGVRSRFLLQEARPDPIVAAAR